jgi:cell division septation protein DedD
MQDPSKKNNSLRADLSHGDAQEFGRLANEPDLEQGTRTAPNRSTRRSTSAQRPRVRVDGIVVVMTISSLLLAASSMFFGYRAMSGGKPISSDVASTKTSRETNNIAQAPGSRPDQFGDKQTGILTGSIDDGATQAEQSARESHVVRPTPNQVGPSEASGTAMASPGTQVLGGAASRTGNAPARTADRELPQSADTPAETNVGSTPASKASPLVRGGFVVQIASERSQHGAQAAFRRLQTRYPSQLRGNQPIIRRADLGAGTYYRALIGPFASRDMASRVCKALKAAGGDCIVQKI